LCTNRRNIKTIGPRGGKERYGDDNDSHLDDNNDDDDDDDGAGVEDDDECGDYY